MASSTHVAPRTERVEVAELVDFLRQHMPFDHLPPDRLRYAARQLEITYAREDDEVLSIEDDPAYLFIIREGAVELHDAQGALVARLGEGDYFGYPSLLTHEPARRRAQTIEDSLLYLLPGAAFNRLRGDCEPFDQFFNRALADRVRHALGQQQEHVALNTPLRTLIGREPVCAPPTQSIREAARQMSEARVSSLLIREDDRLVGILTDRDLRTRVLAEGVSPDAPVSEVMTQDLATLQIDRLAFEALLTMSRHNIHHLPVMDGDEVRGMITTTDLMRLQVDNPVYLVGEVRKQQDVAGIVSVSERLPQLIVHLADTGARAEDTGRLVTAVSDAITERLLTLAEDAFGPPPVPYAWLALGSQGRQEQTAHSDQDNALLLSDDATPEHDDYFQTLAQFVSDGLHESGYVYCPGGVMATTDRWRQRLQQWHRYFRDWIEEPDPKSLMHASIFFDLRHIYGSEALSDDLRAFITERSQDSSIFLASLTVNALDYKPPLGFFRQFVLKSHGDQSKTLDLKHNGVVPVIDIARIFALEHGIEANNTYDRLNRLAGAKAMAASDADDLRDALEFIGMVRLRHQARQIRDGDEPDNYLAPDTLSDFERRHLKDAFKIISRMQSAMEQRYQTSFIR